MSSSSRSYYRILATNCVVQVSQLRNIIDQLERHITDLETQNSTVTEHATEMQSSLTTAQDQVNSFQRRNLIFLQPLQIVHCTIVATCYAIWYTHGRIVISSCAGLVPWGSLKMYSLRLSLKRVVREL